MKYPLYHSELCPAFWDKKDGVWVMKPEICENLMKIAEDFVEVYLEEAGIEMKILDVLLIGSSTNFNWTPFSDLDLHILVDYEELGIGKEFAEILLTAIKINWNKEHDITIKGHDVEIYVQDKNTKAESVSVYSVKNCEWIEPPEKEKIKFDVQEIKRKHVKFKKEIDDMLRTANEEKIAKMLTKLYDFRQYGLDSEMGEFSVENIVFKILRAQGYIQKMRDTAEKIYDKEMTINEGEDMEGWQERDVSDQHSNYYGTDKFGADLDETFLMNHVEKVVKEAAYKGNMGVMEISKFYSTATDEQVKEFEELADTGKTKEAWMYIQAFTEVKLVGDDETFGTPQEVEIYKKLKKF